MSGFTIAPEYNPNKNYLYGAAGTAKFWRHINLGERRASDDAMMKIIEPFGYAFFEAGNINRIIEELAKEKPPIITTFERMQPIMERVFHTYGTREAVKYEKITDESIANRLMLMNQMTIDEVRKARGLCAIQQHIYEYVESHPNQEGRMWRPENPSIAGSKVTQNVRYREPDSFDSPFPYADLSEYSAFGPQLYEMR